MGNRRQFIQRSALFASGMTLPILSAGLRASPTRVRRGTILGPGAIDNAENGEREFYLGMVDLDQPEPYPVNTIQLDFFAHGVSPDPQRPNRSALFQKQGPGACEVDLVEKAVIRPIATLKDRRFYGHGAYSPDGSLLYATETIMSSPDLKGIVSVRDAKTLEYLGEFPSFGAQPHDCQLIDDGKVMAVTNGGLHFG
ncbi:MAG: DUF1513 domain-containing protein, partial [Pseudomonadota bacterium]